MSGASQFDRMERNCKKETQQIQNQQTEDGQSVRSMKSVKSRGNKILNITQKREEDDLGFLDENNQWAAIMKYNSYTFKKECELEQIKR